MYSSENNKSVPFLLAVDSCFVINTINYERGLIRDKYDHEGDKLLYDLLKNEENIYEYYSQNNVRLPDVLKQGYYSYYETRNIDGKLVKDYFRLIDRHKFLLLCKSKGVKFCVFPSVLGELMVGDWGSTSILDSKTFKKFFIPVKVPTEVEDEFFAETIALAEEYVKKGVMKFEYHARSRKFEPQNDAHNQAEPTVVGISLLTDDSDFIKFGQTWNTRRAQAIEEVNVDKGYIFYGTNGTAEYDDYHPKPLTVVHAYSKLVDSKLTFPLNPNIVEKDDSLIVIPKMI